MHSTIGNQRLAGSFSYLRILWIVVPVSLVGVVAIVAIPRWIEQTAARQTMRRSSNDWA